MKRLYAAIAILVLLVAFGLVERYSAVKASKETLELIEEAENAAKNDGSEEYVAQVCTKMSEVWHSNKPALELFLPHNDLDAADLAVDKLVIYSRLADKENTKVYIVEMKNRMKSLGDAEKINIYNLM